VTTPQAVIVTRREEIGIIEIENPPVNALARPVRQALLVAIENLDADHGVRAIVIHGRGRHFIAGADVREFNASPLAPLLNDVLLRLEAASKPVVAAMHGTTLGGGAELSLASHYRCAAPDLSFGLPEAKLGLLPGSGGTVRLPRVAGTERALDFMLSGTPVNLASAQTLGVVDHVLDGDILSGAVAYARELVRTGAKVRRVCELPVPAPANPVLFSERRAGLSAAARRVPANLKIIEAVEAAVALPFRPALARTRELFEECRLSRQSQALRHLFFAERGAGTAGAGARPVARIGIIGAGTMGSGIAMSAATAGYVVTLVDLQAPALAMGLARVKQTMEDSARKGRMTAAAADEAIGRVSGATSLEALSDVDLVIEAVFEKLDVKQSVFRELGRICRADAVLASNTSTLDIDTIAVASGRAGSVIGMHFFSPANIMRLLEIVRGRDTAAEVTATALTVAKRLGKIGIVVGNCFGFVGNRMLYAYGREKELMLLEGASPEQIDRALEGFGMAMGPNAVGDLAGLDIGYSVRREWRDRPDDPRF
jgi:3-hydroxyacyl-CoA dehydrogenase